MRRQLCMALGLVLLWAVESSAQFPPIDVVVTAPLEDATAANGDRGIPMLVRRCDSASTSASADAKYATLCSDSSGNLRTTASLAGNKTNDNAAPSTDLVPVAGAIASTAAQAYTTGRLVLPRVNLFGATPIFLTDPTSGAAVTAATDVTEDAAETAGGTGPFVQNVRRDAAASSAGTTGDNASFNTDALGLLWTRQLDPCSGVAKLYHIVNMVTATTVEIANAVASQFFRICSVNLVAAAAQTIAIGEDDTDGCGSITAGLHGGATAATGWSFAANGGIVLGNGEATVMKTGTANRYLCVITGQATQISGTIAYVSAP